MDSCWIQTITRLLWVLKQVPQWVSGSLRIVEKAAEARANDKARKKLAKENEREARMVELAMLWLGSVCFLFFFLKWLYKVVCIFHSNFNGSIIHLDVVLYIFFSQVQRDDGNDDQLPSSEVWFVGSWQQWPSESGRNATGLWHKWDVLDADAALWHFQVRGFKRNSTLFWWTNI